MIRLIAFTEKYDFLTLQKIATFLEVALQIFVINPNQATSSIFKKRGIDWRTFPKTNNEVFCFSFRGRLQSGYNPKIQIFETPSFAFIIITLLTYAMLKQSIQKVSFSVFQAHFQKLCLL